MGHIQKTLIPIIKKPELAIVILMVFVIAMLVIPLPPVLIDFLIGLNIALSLLIFLSSLYVKDLLQFSTFPAVLLMTTLFRLSLSISTSRLILLDGYAGEIISTFGVFVIGGSLAVGIVIFFIVTIVQFVVITKGAERVAEVCARFSLDSMPGKQMSIDGDMKASALTNEQAIAKRKRLEQENQLFGSMDGAIRFVKGDAIAGLLIILVNFVGGILIARYSYEMTFSQALNVYTILTIGDGLVAQIPALLISIGAGFVVTRVHDDGNNLGESIVLQLFNNTFVLGVACVMLLLIGLLPGFPLVIFILLMSIMAIVLIIKLDGALKYRVIGWLRRYGVMRSEEQVKAQQEDKGGESSVENVLPESIPVILLAAAETCDFLKEQGIVSYAQRLFFLEFGIPLPRTELVARDSLPCGQVQLLVHEIEVQQMTILSDHVRIIDRENLAILESLDIPVSRVEGAPPQYWCPKHYASELASLQIDSRSDVDEIYRIMAGGLSRLVNEYFGIQDTKELLDKIDSKSPELMKEVYRNATVQRVSEVFQRLVNEGVSLRNSKIILECIAQHAGKEKDNLALTELVRGRLARYISNKYKERGKIRCLILTQHIEDEIRRNIKTTSTGSFLNIDPEEHEEFFSLFVQAIKSTEFSPGEFVLLSSMDVRRFVKKMVDGRFPDLDVLSWQEITNRSQLQVLGNI